MPRRISEQSIKKVRLVLELSYPEAVSIWFIMRKTGLSVTSISKILRGISVDTIPTSNGVFYRLRGTNA